MTDKMLQREDHAVINVDGQEGDILSINPDVDAGISHCRLESVCLEIGVECVVPLEGRLFKPIQALVQATDMVQSLRVNKALWLADVVFLSECCIEEHSGDVHLVDFISE